MLISTSVKKPFPSESTNFSELEGHYREVQKRFYSRTISRSQQKQPLGANSVNYLISALVRGKFLLEGFASALESENALSGFLVVRAHYETTGAVAFFLRELARFKNGQYDAEALSQALRRMTLGMRIKQDKNGPMSGRVPIICSVLNYIDEVDAFLRTNSSAKKDLFRNNYEVLSEYCHPNAHSLLIGSKKNPLRVVQFEQRPRLSERHLHTLLAHLLPSSFLFLRLYDTAWRIVEESFEMPELEK